MNRGGTIAAVATAAGRAAIGVIRISGPTLRTFSETLTRRKLEARSATLTAFYDGAGQAIDRGIAIFFPAPHSYTGEDVVELQGHGGNAVLRLLLRRCVELGARLAEPGEFTQRAFLNGKLDLVQAESVIDLIDASTSQAVRGAMRSLQGEFSQRINALASGLIEIRAYIEATLDFPEEDVDALDNRATKGRLEGLQQSLDEVFASAQRGSLLREGVDVVIAGAPNVGKSSLLNRLAGEELAIVTDIPGTTRDPIRQVIDVGGIPVRIIDTAGLRETADRVERIGVDRALRAIEGADLLVLVSDAVTPSAASTDLLARMPAVPQLYVTNKIDLVGAPAAVEITPTGQRIWLSAKTGEGLELFTAALRELAGVRAGDETVFLARERHLRLLDKARAHLNSAAGQDAPELIAEELRLAHEALTGITGEFTSDDLLGEIFSRFCIGK